jgi:amino acid transporter
LTLVALPGTLENVAEAVLGECSGDFGGGFLMSMSQSGAPPAADTGTSDADQLRDLGYATNFDRTMSLWENFALGFTYLSPVVGVYSVFAVSVQAAGPMMVWSYVLAGLGQMMVCLVFSEIVAQFPISGGLYPWSRRLVGKGWAWMSGWVYAWALFSTIAGAAVGVGPFLADALGFDATPGNTAIIALLMVVAATVVNLQGTKTLARVAMFGFVCELVGAVVVGVYLLAFHRHHPIGMLFSTHGILRGGSYLPAFLAGATAGLFCCYGFEACADVAEETPDPGHSIPRAMRMTIYIGVSASIFVCVALLLALPDLDAVIAGTDTNPVSAVLKAAFGITGAKVVVGVVMVSFLSCILSLQAAVSRLLFAYGRDGMILGSSQLVRIASHAHVPWVALLVAGAVPAAIIGVSPFLQDAIATIINFATAGIYLAFQMVVAAALYARFRGWRPGGVFTLGAWGVPVNMVALVYGLGALTDIVWPRTPDQPWYLNYGMLVTIICIGGAGLLYMVFARSHDRGDAPAADAWDITSRAQLRSAKKVGV